MSLSESISKYRKTGDSEFPFVDIIEFALSPQYCGIKRLYPVQKVLLKLVYGLPLGSCYDDPIIIRDQFNERELYKFDDEMNFFRFLRDEGKINCEDYNYPLTELYMIIGRRGTKTTISSIISAYTLYMINTFDDPYDYFGLLDVSEMGVAITSNSDDNAARQSRELGSLVYGSPFFKPFLIQKEPPVSGFQLKTRRAVRERRPDLAKITVSVKAASPSVRGGSYIVVICDEIAHYVDSNARSKRDQPLDEYIHSSITPSISGFKSKSGTPMGKAIFITSPNGKKGRVWRVKDKLSVENKDMLFVNMPSWWVNTELPPTILKNAWKSSERSFRQEYGAEFVEKESGWIKNFHILDRAFDSKLDNSYNQADRKKFYYCGLDLALTSDNAAIAVCHYEPKDIEREFRKEEYAEQCQSQDAFVFDYLWQISPERGVDISVDGVIDKMVEVSAYFRTRMWSWDQWSESMFRQWLARRGFSHPYQKVAGTPTWNSDAARLFMTLLNEGRIILPDDESIEDEILGLTESLAGQLIKVENTSGHDDRFSAMLKALWVCYHDMSKGVVNTVTEDRRRANFLKKSNQKVLALRRKRDFKHTQHMR